MTETTNNTDNTTVETPTEGKKRGRPATYDPVAFEAALREVHAAGGDVQALADRLGFPKTKVLQISAHMRNQGIDLPKFRRGRKKGSKNAPKVVETPTVETAPVEQTETASA